jgi:glycosyltransferase involved in cell wall biosynthesis
MVVTGFNQEAFILETLQSIEAQTYPNIEIVVIDGGGTEPMGEVAKKFLATSRFKGTLFRQPENLGMMMDRQRGYELARGEYVCFLDGDDLAFPNRVEKQVGQILEHDCDAVYGSLVRILEGPGRVISPPPPVQAAESWDPELFVERLVFHHGPMAQGGLFKRSLLQEIGGIDQGFPMNDWPFMIESARRAKRMMVSREPVFYYRVHPDSHHLRQRKEAVRWQAEVARHYCSERVRRTSLARSYRIAANDTLREGDVGQALAWFAKAAMQRRQRKVLPFLRTAVGTTLRRGTRKGTKEEGRT